MDVQAIERRSLRLQNLKCARAKIRALMIEIQHTDRDSRRASASSISRSRINVFQLSAAGPPAMLMKCSGRRGSLASPSMSPSVNSAAMSWSRSRAVMAGNDAAIRRSIG